MRSPRGTARGRFHAASSARHDDSLDLPIRSGHLACTPPHAIAQIQSVGDVQMLAASLAAQAPPRLPRPLSIYRPCVAATRRSPPRSLRQSVQAVSSTPPRRTHRRRIRVPASSCADSERLAPAVSTVKGSEADRAGGCSEFAGDRRKIDRGFDRPQSAAQRREASSLAFRHPWSALYAAHTALGESAGGGREAPRRLCAARMPAGNRSVAMPAMTRCGHGIAR